MKTLVKDRSRVMLLKVAISSLIVVLICISSAVTIGIKTYHAAQLSPVVAHLGSASVSIDITDNPACSSLLFGCPIVPPPNSLNYLTVWAAFTTQQNGRQITSARRILVLPVQ